MKTKILYTSFAKNDLKEIYEWYLKIDKRIWEVFLKKFRLKVEYIRENPLSLELKYDKNRIAF